jgi:hypothetical protein
MKTSSGKQLSTISMEKRILNIAIKHWNERFTGISSLDIARELKISNVEAMKFMENLSRGGEGTLNANVTLYEVKLNFNKKTKTVEAPDPEPVQTHIFFPSKSVLQKYQERNHLKYFSDGEYKKRIRRGYGQIDLVYFEIKVLSKYIDNREHYDLNDDITGGIIRLHHDVSSKISQEDYDEKGFDKIWYGKRKLANNETVISAILIDLSELPVKEQSYWYGFQIDSPLFAEHDPDFEKFIAKTYDGEWVESNDPIESIYEAIRAINSILPLPIFNHLSNPYLKYPTNNTFKDFADANSELYKIVGPDNLISTNVEKLYLEIFQGNSQDLIHNESKRPLSNMQIFQLILDRLNPESVDIFKKHWAKIKNYRIEGDHKITIPKITSENYIDMFRLVCENTGHILSRISKEFKIKIGS